MKSAKFSYWEKESFLKSIDFAVIGGGIVGLSTAIYLKKHNPRRKVVVLERDVFSAGASTKNAGFACIGSPGELLSDLETMPADDVFSLLDRRYRGLINLRELLGDKRIGYDPCGGFELFGRKDQESYNICSDQLDYLNQEIFNSIGERPYSVISVNEKRWPFRGIENAIFNNLEGGLNTGEMMKSFFQLARELDILILNGMNINTVTDEKENAILHVDNDMIEASHAVICTNGFARMLLPELEVMPARNQVLVTEKITNLSLNGTFHMDKGFVYFREIDNRILLGGKRNLDLTGESTSEFGLTELIQESLESLLRESILPGRAVNIEHRWSGILGIGPSKTVIRKSITPHVHVAVRMGGMGVAIGSLVGKEMAEMFG